MDKKYVISADDNNMIYRVCVNTEEGQKIINITDRYNKEKYMQQLNKIDEEYGDFYQHLYGENCYIIKQNYNSETVDKAGLESETNHKKVNFDNDQMFIISNEKEISEDNSFDSILDQARTNSVSVSKDNEMTPFSIATRIVQLNDVMNKLGYDMDLGIVINFVKAVDKDGNPIDNDKSKWVEDSIVKVTVRLDPGSRTLFFSEPITTLLDRRISGYVNFSEFIKNLSDLGYSMTNNSWRMPDSISDLYDENGNLELSSLKDAAEYDRFACRFVKTEKLKRNDNEKKSEINEQNSSTNVISNSQNYANNDFESRMYQLREVIKNNDPQKYDDLMKYMAFTAPELRPSKYSEWVQQNYEINPNNSVSLIVYSLLMNMPVDELKNKMISDLNSKGR